MGFERSEKPVLSYLDIRVTSSIYPLWLQTVAVTCFNEKKLANFRLLL
jgi:hypothetical protein